MEGKTARGGGKGGEGGESRNAKRLVSFHSSPRSGRERAEMTKEKVQWLNKAWLLSPRLLFSFPFSLSLSFSTVYRNSLGIRDREIPLFFSNESFPLDEGAGVGRESDETTEIDDSTKSIVLSVRGALRCKLGVNFGHLVFWNVKFLRIRRVSFLVSFLIF